MLEAGETMMIQIMYKQGYSKKQIARELGISINTVRKYVRSDKPPAYKCRRTEKPRKLDAHREYIESRIASALPGWIPATVIFSEIRARGYSGGISLLRAYMLTLKPQSSTAVLRFETEPGKQMQVDWAEFPNKSGRRLSAFIATLGYSRMSYVEYVENEQLPTLLSCHEHAFDYFGGVPQQVLYDNMKTVIVARDYYGEGQHRLQAGFWDFAKHYQFIPKVCRPYRAQTKGKVERFIHYLKHSFHYPLVAQLKEASIKLDVDTANHYVIRWLNETANTRVHATTNEKPIVRFQVEQRHLQVFSATYSGSSPRHTIAKPKDYSHRAIEQQPQDVIQHELSVYESLLAVEQQEKVA